MELPYLTAGIPGVGGLMRQSEDDFVVEEIPLYEPCGEGTHVYLTIRKRGLTTDRVVGLIAKALGVAKKDVGFAGLKDAKSVSIQRLSVEHVDIERVMVLDIPGVEVLDAKKHGNKLKKGHLLGNRFNLKIRGADIGKRAELDEICKVLKKRGVPNFFGEQRFGNDGDNHERGREILLSGSRRLDSLEKFLVNAYQSYLFNKVLIARLDEIDKLRVGDYAYLHSNGAVFYVDGLEGLEERLERFDISPSGPLFGYKVVMADGAVGEIERSVIGSEALPDDCWRALNMRGERRSLRIKVEALKFAWEGNELYISFCLPAGSFATIVMREIMKTA